MKKPGALIKLTKREVSDLVSRIDAYRKAMGNMGPAAFGRRISGDSKLYRRIRQGTLKKYTLEMIEDFLCAEWERLNLAVSNGLRVSMIVQQQRQAEHKNGAPIK